MKRGSHLNNLFIIKPSFSVMQFARESRKVFSLDSSVVIMHSCAALVMAQCCIISRIQGAIVQVTMSSEYQSICFMRENVCWAKDVKKKRDVQTYCSRMSQCVAFSFSADALYLHMRCFTSLYYEGIFSYNTSELCLMVFSVSFPETLFFSSCINFESRTTFSSVQKRRASLYILICCV